MRTSSRGQAAMEFLMTYGWAILAVLVMIGALAYFGVMRVDVSERCVLTTGFGCRDYQAYQLAGESAGIEFVLENGRGEGVIIETPFDMTTAEGGIGTCQGSGMMPGNVTVNSDARQGFLCFVAFGYPGAGQMVKAKLNGSYYLSSGVYPHTFVGELIVRAR